jgi:hypothetical protein
MHACMLVYMWCPPLLIVYARQCLLNEMYLDGPLCITCFCSCLLCLAFALVRWLLSAMCGLM